jgi:hypothetical protein
MPELQPLRDDIAGLTTAVKAQTKKLTASRRVIRALAVLAVVQLGLVVWLFLITESQRASCHSTNATRAQSAQLWNHFLDIATPKKPTPPVTSALADLRSAVASTYAPKKCSAPLR